MGNSEDEPVKINKWDGSALKNALDDAVKSVMLDQLKYVERFTLVDIRLTLCTVAVAVALAAIGWDYLHPFPESRPVLLVCSSLYFVVSVALTAYVTFVERGIFLVAVERDSAGKLPDRVCHLRSSLKRYDDQYTLELCYREGGASPQRNASLQRSVADFVSTDGALVTNKLQQAVLQLHARVARAPSKKN